MIKHKLCQSICNVESNIYGGICACTYTDQERLQGLVNSYTVNIKKHQYTNLEQAKERLEILSYRLKYLKLKEVILCLKI